MRNPGGIKEKINARFQIPDFLFHPLTFFLAPKVAEMEEFDRLVEIVDTLRSEKGCAWDKVQKLEHLRTYLLEETCELIDALNEKDEESVKEELGDLFLLLVFVSRIFKEEKRFTVKDVLGLINEKLVFRHPHVFSSLPLNSPEEIVEHWVQAKARDKKRDTVADRLPRSAPALLLALLFCKEGRCLGEPADSAQLIRQITEALGSFSGSGQKEELLATVLIDIARIAAAHKIDPENALRRAVLQQAGKTSYLRREDKDEG